MLATAPPGTEYSLTDLGRSLLEPLQALAFWAEQHTEELLDARERLAPVP
jgi:DNA-binding HxlR family transcriptional regulator